MPDQEPDPQGPLQVKLTLVKTRSAPPAPLGAVRVCGPCTGIPFQRTEDPGAQGPANEARAKALVRALRQGVAAGEVACR